VQGNVRGRDLGGVFKDIRKRIQERVALPPGYFIEYGGQFENQQRAMTRLSCHDFVDNQVRLQLFALAYNVGNFLRRLALPKSIKDWSLRTMRENLVKIGPKVVRHARYVTFQMAEILVSRSLFHEILERIQRLKPVPIETG